jgi:serine carboxypeptidase-like clade I
MFFLFFLFFAFFKGVGFSYCADGPCPWWNDTTSAVEQAEFICNWFELFPEYISNDFYIAGESYAGVFIPTTTIELLKTKCNGVNSAFPDDVTINYKGVAIGNGCTGIDAGPCNQQRSVNTFNQLYQQGFVSISTYNLVNSACADSNGYVEADQDCQVKQKNKK